jgi:hypothetical protein
MADATQASFFKGELVIHCDSRWGCCQRAQAQQKVNGMNTAIDAKGGSTKRSASMTKIDSNKDPLKKGYYSMQELTTISRKDATDEMSDMSKNQKADEAERRGAHPCLVERMRDKNKKTKTQNDHELDVCICGDPFQTLIPTDSVVNGMIGNICQQVPEGETIKKVVLVCPPSTDPKCPDQSSVAKQTQKPKKKGPQPADVSMTRTTRFTSY